MSTVNTKNNPLLSQAHSTDANDISQNTEYFLNRGLYKAEAADYRGAIADFNQAILSNSNSAQTYHNRGLACFKLGETQAAIKDFTQALRLNPNYTEAYLDRGNAYRKLRDHQGAIIDYTQMLRLYPSDAKAYYNRGVAYSELGDKQRAIQDYQKAVNFFYEQGDAANSKRAWENLNKLQPQAKPPERVGNAAKPFNSRATSSHFNSSPSSKSQENQLKLDQASRKLQNKLLNLVQGDRELAIRLVSQVKNNNPGRSVDWCIEKVIYDLERDRSR
jgi:tetratricopeptide (TPR) repeat protein